MSEEEYAKWQLGDEKVAERIALNSVSDEAIDTILKDRAYRINREAKLYGSEKTWGEFVADPNNATRYDNLSEYLDGYERLIEKQSPWPDGYDKTKNIVTLKPGDEFYMVLDVDQKIPGGWGLKEEPTSVDFVRNYMAVKVAWKSDCGVVAKYKIKEGTYLDVPKGPVGPQIDLVVNKYLPGSMNITQYDLFYQFGNTRVNRLDFIELVGGSYKLLK